MEKAACNEHVIGIPVSNRAFGIEEPDFPSEGAAAYHAEAKSSATARTSSRFGRTGDRLAQGIKEHGTFFSSPSWTILLLILDEFDFSWLRIGELVLNNLFLMICSDSRTKTVRDHERQADAGRENPPGRRRGEGLPPVVRRRQGREAPEGLPVLPVHHGRPDRRHALHIDGEDRVPERPVAGADHPERRHGACAVQGGHPSEEGEDGQAEREQAPAGAEVRPGGDRRRLRVLVHGIRQLPGDPEEPGAGRRAGAVIDRSLMKQTSKLGRRFLGRVPCVWSG